MKGKKLNHNHELHIEEDICTIWKVTYRPNSDDDYLIVHSTERGVVGTRQCQQNCDFDFIFKLIYEEIS